MCFFLYLQYTALIFNNKNVDLLVVLDEKSMNLQSNWDSSSGHHGYLYQISMAINLMNEWIFFIFVPGHVLDPSIKELFRHINQQKTKHYNMYTHQQPTYNVPVNIQDWRMHAQPCSQVAWVSGKAHILFLIGNQRYSNMLWPISSWYGHTAQW